MSHCQHNANPEGLHIEERFDGIREHVDESRGQNHPGGKGLGTHEGCCREGETRWNFFPVVACWRSGGESREELHRLDVRGVTCGIAILMVMAMEARDNGEWLLMVWSDASLEDDEVLMAVSQ
ncbi:uncharacterized protein HKW66_Vig0167160 [Vigna angularis]|uniref:Uncharacterized protein n=1 Tax=Phaseolus angularis TaxID=3914 RepID=A0A8T0JRS1_PHAAN|nr:uncharacterized protein HKW66_Vig0167160 [Vigna angularis]